MNAVLLRWNVSNVGCRPVVLGVVQSRLSQPECRRAPVVLGVVPMRVVPPSAAARVVSALVPHASARRSLGAPAQPAAVADAASRPKIGAFLQVGVTQRLSRSTSAAQLSGSPLARWSQVRSKSQGGQHVRLRSSRSIQRHFAMTIGMSPRRVKQIMSARKAVELLLQGIPPVEVAYFADIAVNTTDLGIHTADA